MQWYEREGYFKKRFLREIEFIKNYNKGKSPQEKINFGINKQTGELYLTYRHVYMDMPYFILCIFPSMYPKVRITVIVFDHEINPFGSGFHNAGGVLCLLAHYPNQWKEEYGVEFILQRVGEWFEEGQYDATNVLPLDYNQDKELFIFGDQLLNVKETGIGVFEYIYINKEACIVTQLSFQGNITMPENLPLSFKGDKGKHGKGLILFTNNQVQDNIGVETFKKIKPYLNKFRHGKKGIIEFAKRNCLGLPIPFVVIEIPRANGYTFLIGDKNIEVGRFSRFRVDEGIFQRLDEQDGLNRLKAKKVAILGLGALGSTIATELVRNGITDFLLVDHDKLAIENISRHDLTLKDIDKYKVDAVKDKILDINPQVKCRTIRANVIDDMSKTLEILPKYDIVISALDDQEAKFAVDSTLIAEGKKVIFSGVFYNAIAGFALISEKKLGCFRCISTIIDEMARKGKIPDFSALVPKDIDYSCGLPSFPGNSINSHTVALLTARLVVDILLQRREVDGRGYPYNFYLVGNQRLELNKETFFAGYMDVKKYVLPGIVGCEICDDEQVNEDDEDLYKLTLRKLKT